MLHGILGLRSAWPQDCRYGGGERKDGTFTGAARPERDGALSVYCATGFLLRLLCPTDPADPTGPQCRDAAKYAVRERRRGALHRWSGATSACDCWIPACAGLTAMMALGALSYARRCGGAASGATWRPAPPIPAARVPAASPWAIPGQFSPFCQ